MPKKEEHGVAPVACNSHCQLSYVFSFGGHAKILLSLAFSQFLFFVACESTCFLIDLRFRKAIPKVAQAKNARKEGRSSKDLKKSKKVKMRFLLNVLAFFAGAAVRLPSRKRKSIRKQVPSQAEKKTNCENAKESRIFA